MKRQYSKPTLSVERYSLTQSVASCYIKIFTDDSLTQSKRAMMDPDSKIEMKNMARLGGFIDATCTLSLRFSETHDGTCYHTNVNGAFSS